MNMSTTDEKRLREADLWFAAFEQGKVWDKATARACFIAGHALGHQAATREAESAKPYGQITTHSQTGQQFFYRWPEPPYLDNASECVTVYTREPAAPVDTRDALTDEQCDKLVRVYWDAMKVSTSGHADRDAIRAVIDAALARQAAAPVDALMQMAREELSVMASYANTPDLSVGLRIRAIASAECIAKIDAALARQAAAPAERVK